MEITATAKYIRISPRKVRLVAEAIRKISPALALSQLRLMRKGAAKPLYSLLKSALANAANKVKLSIDNLAIKAIVVEGGPALKRFRPVSRGRSHAYKKRMSHIKIVLEEKGATGGAKG